MRPPFSRRFFVVFKLILVDLGRARTSFRHNSPWFSAHSPKIGVFAPGPDFGSILGRFCHYFRHRAVENALREAIGKNVEILHPFFGFWSILASLLAPFWLPKSPKIHLRPPKRPKKAPQDVRRGLRDHFEAQTTFFDDSCRDRTHRLEKHDDVYSFGGREVLRTSVLATFYGKIMPELKV